VNYQLNDHLNDHQQEDVANDVIQDEKVLKDIEFHLNDCLFCAEGVSKKVAARNQARRQLGDTMEVYEH
jgi:hypothetical protein